MSSCHHLYGVSFLFLSCLSFLPPMDIVHVISSPSFAPSLSLILWMSMPSHCAFPHLLLTRLVALVIHRGKER
ncbi:hypothetical protein GGR50DRAFT_646891 [Xylaria sp. CBS 124048]|nr:hypothetical protein GGR50DRAFT_646891 [Xylaria sp. CBS 124048]